MNIAQVQTIRSRQPLRAPLALALAAALGLAAFPGLANATTFTVTSSGDSGDGVCDATCTLRDAVVSANALTGSNVVTFASNLSGDTIILDIAGKGNIDISGDLTIQGPGANQLTVSGGNVASSQDGGVLNFNGTTLTLSGITLTDGSTAHFGGALASAGKLSLIDVAITDCHASLFAGGFYARGGPINVTHSTISGNSADISGGGFTSNYATVALVDSTISSNTANNRGGGFYARASINVSNSTVSGNMAGSGGGFWLNKFDGAVTNSIVANNTASSAVEFLVTGPGSGVTSNLSANNTLIEGSYSVDGTFSGNNNILGQDPLLGTLANNGGSTFTLALLPGSPAIDNGDNATCESTDQRGIARPIDGDANGATICDMGAVEYQPDVIFANGFESQGN